jgi:hypothetical protein
MGVEMAGLTVAWLDAVLRTQAKPSLVPERMSDKQGTLTDAIEGALRTGGVDSRDPNWVDPLAPPKVDPLAPGQVVDINA